MMSGMSPHDQEQAPVPDQAVVRDFDDFHASTYRFVLRAARRAASGDLHTARDAVQDAYVTMLANWINRCDRSLGENRAFGSTCGPVAIRRIDLLPNSEVLNRRDCLKWTIEDDLFREWEVVRSARLSGGSGVS
jgi:hypothetical protein